MKKRQLKIIAINRDENGQLFAFDKNGMKHFLKLQRNQGLKTGIK